MPRPDRTPAATDRAAKAARIQKAGAAAEWCRGVLIWGSAVAVVVLIVGAVVFAVVRDSPALADLSAVQDFDNTAADHREEQIDYDSAVPPGGPRPAGTGGAGTAPAGSRGERRPGSRWSYASP